MKYPRLIIGILLIACATIDTGLPKDSESDDGETDVSWDKRGDNEIIDTNTSNGMENDSQIERNGDTGGDSETDSKKDVDTKVDTSVGGDTSTLSEMDSDMDSNGGSTPETDGEADIDEADIDEADIDIDTDMDTYVDVDTDTDIDSDTDIGGDADVEFDASSDSGVDSDTDESAGGDGGAEMVPKSLIIEELTDGYCSADGYIETEYDGYSGDGYVNTENDEGMGIVWSVLSQKDAYVFVGWRYATRTNRPARLLVNEQIALSGIEFTSADEWNEWRILSRTIRVSRGINILRLEAEGRWGLAYIDYFAIFGTGLSEGACSEDPVADLDLSRIRWG